MSRPSRRQVQSYQPPQVYSSVPTQSPPRANSAGHSSQPYQSQVGGPRPVQGRSHSASSSSQQHSSAGNGHHHHSSSQSHARYNERRMTGRNGVAMGVATGQIGSGYGPYSYNPNQQGKNAGVYAQSRFSNTPSEGSLSTSQEQAQAAPQPPPPQQTTTVPTYMWDKEPDLDDALHHPDPRRDNSCTPFSWRGWVNVSAIFLLVLGLLTLFAGYPIIDFARKGLTKVRGYNLGGINGTGQIPEFPGMPHLIDLDTPRSAYSRTGTDGKKYDLVFSDEFNVEGRTFWPGDDPFWEAVDLHYWATGDSEWYDPGQAITAGGKLVLTLEQRLNHDLNFISGMVTSWNKICFTTGYIEVSVSLPGNSRVPGLWPGVWTLGNLGRAGHGASTEGLWPYSYDSCDLGTFRAQTGLDGSPGADVLTNQGHPLSSLPGQRLSACTCPGSDHPGPRANVGRGAPEVDIIEAGIDVDRFVGQVSQSLQVAPYNDRYLFNEGASTIYNSSVTSFNSYKGGPYQQAVSALSDVASSDVYNGKAYATYGFELWSDPNRRSDGYITWINNGIPMWKATAATVGPDSVTKVGQRLISEEPMYVILNLGMAHDFQPADYKNLQFPAKMYIDYVRIYQRAGIKDGLTCNPPNRPTSDYISRHMNAYTNANLTTWAKANYTFPRNSLYDGC